MKKPAFLTFAAGAIAVAAALYGAGAFESDKQVQVLVFDSNVPGNFIAHYDLLKPLADSTGMNPGPDMW